jgi:hypothetical protein
MADAFDEPLRPGARPIMHAGGRRRLSVQRDWGSFFVDIFKKSPLVGSFLLFGVVAGAGMGLHWTWRGFEEGVSVRFLLLVILTIAIIGGIIGLAIGVMIDSILGAIWKNDQKRPPTRR